MEESGDDVAHETDRRHGNGVGELCRNVVDVLDLRPGGGHNRGVGNGGAVVAADGTRQAGRNADNHEGVIVGENRGDNGNQDAERAPGGTGGEGQYAGDEENHGGEHTVEVVGGPGHGVAHELRRAELVVGHGLQADGERQDDNGRTHRVEALGHTGHSFLEVQAAAEEDVADDDDHGDNAAPREAHKGVGIAECADDVPLVVGSAPPVCPEEAADVEHAERAGDNQEHNRDEQVNHAAPVIFFVLRGTRKAAQISGADSLFLKAAHGAVVEPQQNQQDDKQERQQGVEVVGNGADEEFEAANAGIELLCGAGHRRRPRGYRRNHAHRRGGRVNQVGEFRPANAVPVGDGSHDRADGQAIKIVVDENQDTQQEGRQLRADAGADILFGPAPERGGASGGVHECHDDAQQDEEDKDSGVGLHGRHEAVFDNRIKGSDGVEVAGEERPHDDTDKQRPVGLLGNQREKDGDKRRDERPPGAVERGVRGRFLSLGERGNRQKAAEQQHHGQEGHDAPRHFFHASHSLAKDEVMTARALSRGRVP